MLAFRTNTKTDISKSSMRISLEALFWLRNKGLRGFTIHEYQIGENL